MSRHLSHLAHIVRGLPVRVIGEAVGRAVALTDTELITVRAGILRTTTEHFRLGALRRIGTISGLHASLLEMEMEFEGAVPERFTLMFNAQGAVEFDLIATLLRQRLGLGDRGRLLQLNPAARRRNQMRAVQSGPQPISGALAPDCASSAAQTKMPVSS